MELRPPATATAAVAARAAIAAVHDQHGHVVTPARAARAAIPGLAEGRRQPNSIAPGERDSVYSMELVLMPSTSHTSLVSVTGGVAASDSKRILMARADGLLGSDPPPVGASHPWKIIFQTDVFQRCWNYEKPEMIDPKKIDDSILKS